MLKQEKGITLIALVITIIVLLILAGVTIAMLSGENGILTRSTQTRSENAIAQETEQAKLAYMMVRTEIASNMATNGNYSASGAHATLKGKVDTDLGAISASDWGTKGGWTTSSDASGITMKFKDSAVEKVKVWKITFSGTNGNTAALVAQEDEAK